MSAVSGDPGVRLPLAARSRSHRIRFHRHGNVSDAESQRTKYQTKTKLTREPAVVQVMDRTEKLMMKAIVRYREDQDLENAIDFIQKKVNLNP